MVGQVNTLRDPSLPIVREAEVAEKRLVDRVEKEFPSTLRNFHRSLDDAECWVEQIVREAFAAGLDFGRREARAKIEHEIATAPRKPWWERDR